MDQPRLLSMSESTKEAVEVIGKLWLLTAALFTLCMQAGYALNESGMIRKQNSLSVLSKNILNIAITAIAFLTIGYGIANGDVDGGVIGSKYYFANNLEEDDHYFTWLLYCAVTSLVSTITSGAIAERMRVNVFLVFSFIISGVICPLIIAWTWGKGWLNTMEFQDNGGSMVVS
mmetsp:Transcript_36054/g.41041  ORF Transcript_36054/g.41041 Transcript_36054/m.41041 type:complete len:174 (-) Transcript_36054:1578-2099(-)